MTSSAAEVCNVSDAQDASETLPQRRSKPKITLNLAAICERADVLPTLSTLSDVPEPDIKLPWTRGLNAAKLTCVARSC